MIITTLRDRIATSTHTTTTTPTEMILRQQYIYCMYNIIVSHTTSKQIHSKNYTYTTLMQMHINIIPKTTTVESLWDGSVVLVGEVGVGEETLGTVVLVVALLDAEITLGQSVNTKDIHITTRICICY